MSLKRSLIDNLKNIRGWRTNRRTVVFCVDDYGAVRLASAEARDRIEAAGVALRDRFDRLDAVETVDDLNALFEVLSSVRDGAGRHPVFTTYALSANPDFDVLREEGRYAFEDVITTFERLSAEQPAAYGGAFALLKQGMREGLLRPQFHGREHLQVDVIEEKLKLGDGRLKASIDSDSTVALGPAGSDPTVGFTQAFAPMGSPGEALRFQARITEGLELFRQAYGLRSTTFTPPAHRLEPSMYRYAENVGIRAIDKPLRSSATTGRGRRRLHRLGRHRGDRHISIVRNVVFEPSEHGPGAAVALALSQMEAAFRWRRPALISSHRVNFAGHIEPSNRAQGLGALRELLQRALQRWPDVEFTSADQLAAEVEATCA